MLRLRIPGAALFLTLAAANPLVAQTMTQPFGQPAPTAVAPPAPSFSPGHLQAARDVVIGSGIAASFASIVSEFGARMTQSLSTRPEVLKELDGVLKGQALKDEADKRIEEMIMSSARIFAGSMNEADLKQVAAFFGSDVGKRFNAIRPDAIDKIFNVLQPWSLKTSGELFEVLRAEMKKKGHDL